MRVAAEGDLMSYCIFHGTHGPCSSCESPNAIQPEQRSVDAVLLGDTTHCPHCGGAYRSSYPSHCMANLAEGARRTELLGRYVIRAEAAEADLARLRAALTIVTYADGAGPDFDWDAYFTDALAAAKEALGR